ncbi:MAG TPA: hypothetical protein VFF81_04380 [Noviherbaspirillum sp.]|nr:hypothetical protein [Noviherbaspirillum sp.]
MSHLDILIPFALPPAEMSADLLKELHLPALATLTARASGAARRNEVCTEFSRALPHEKWLSQQFGMADTMTGTGSPPIAKALMQSFGLPPHPGRWFVLQPVHIHIARDHLVLTDVRHLDLTEAESRSLFDIAKPLFEEAGKELFYGNATTWFLRSDEWTDLKTSSPDAATGHNIDIWMPKGPGERDWRRVQNEVQMHWHNHPLNEERETRRLKPINSLWLWGGSADVPGVSDGYSHTFNLSSWMKAFEEYVPHRMTTEKASEAISARPKRGLLVLDGLLEPALSNDWGRWLEHMRSFEAEWFAPLLDALKSGTIGGITTILTNDARISHFATTRSSLRKFWIKPTLASLRP